MHRRAELDQAATRDWLVARADADPRIVAAALVGSAARGEEDRWSDVDLALRLAPDADEAAVVEDWTDAVRTRGLADVHDVWSGGVRYRVYLLHSSLQVDVSFWPYADFRATGPAFRLLFGEAGPSDPVTEPEVGGTIGLAWLYALHARSAIARGRTWQAVQMLDLLRDAVVELRCVEAGLPGRHGRGVDRLPTAVLDRLAEARAAHLDEDELWRSLAALVAELQGAVTVHDADRAGRLGQALGIIARP